MNCEGGETRMYCWVSWSCCCYCLALLPLLLLPDSIAAAALFSLKPTSSVSFFLLLFVCVSSELDVFQMVLMVVALGLLAASALYWLAVCYSRSRWEIVC